MELISEKNKSKKRERLSPKELIFIPNTALYQHQKRIWELAFKGRPDEKGNLVKATHIALEWHRRAGKDIFSLQFLLNHAYDNPGNYFYIFPLKNQARLAIFEGIDKDGKPLIDYIPKKLVTKIDTNEMKIFIITKDNRRSTIQFIGADADSKVGANFKGGIFSEYAVYRSTRIWNLIEPMIQFNKGWVLFNSTPRGRNHFATLHNKFKELSENNLQYYAETLTIEETKDFFNKPLMSKEEFNIKMKEGLVAPELLMQEYYCNREAASAGGWYKDQIFTMEQSPNKLQWFSEEPLKKFYVDPLEPVYVSLDIGGPTENSDYMVIHIGQNHGTEKTIHYTYGNKGELIGHYVQKIKEFRRHHGIRPGIGTYIFLPHDAKRTENIQGRSMYAYLREEFPEFECVLVPKSADKIADIHYVRARFSEYNFGNDANDGFEKLKFFRKKYNATSDTYSDEEVEHDVHSHWADSFKYYVFGMDILLKQKSFTFGQSISYSY